VIRASNLGITVDPILRVRAGGLLLSKCFVPPAPRYHSVFAVWIFLNTLRTWKLKLISHSSVWP
jgi:hypothetical protein